ncbi:MAG TPA: transposase [candidate division Zixibacteria bacterium]|nr:transposase [candidate division Zixibacteria bacterium]
MLISESHNFIFIHIYKNAGTSIKAALRPFATSVFQERMSGIACYPVLGNLASLLMRFDRFNPTPYPSHVSAQKIVSELGNDTYNAYFTFAVVRNPWDWQVSLYNYMLKNSNHHQHELAKNFGSFGEYIRWRCSEEVRYQRDFIYSDQGDLLVDFVGRFEQIEQDFQSICSRIGVSATLPRMNVSSAASYREYYDKETMDLVSKIFEPDILTFGYRFV